MERPIEEVIGWRRTPGGYLWEEGGMFGGPMHDHATVDDLAAWLDERGEWLRIDGPDAWGGMDGYRAIVYSDTQFRGYGPTILAALTAAVRKVAGDA